MVMPQFKKTFGLPEDKKATADIVSNVVSTLQAGCFLGALIAFYIADKWGRRPSLLSAASMAIFGIVIQTTKEPIHESTADVIAHDKNESSHVERK